MRLTPLAPASLLLVLALSSCGNQMQADTNENSAEGRAPACADVWTEGTTVPADYTGCEQDASLQPLEATTCADGTELTTFADQYFAVLGGQVRAGGPDSASYADALEACEG